jgi:cold shock CspA family protein
MPRNKNAAPSKPAYAGQAMTGRIKRAVGGQGSGIITASVGDVFFHKSDVQGDYWELKPGDRVTFELLDDTISGPRAQHVKMARAAKKAR